MAEATTKGRPRKSKTGGGGDGSLTDYSVGIIRDRILDLTLSPGQRVNERLLMERFGLSRTPAREALNRLAAEGLIDIRRNLGAYVHPLDMGHIRQFFEAYVAAERLVGHLVNCDRPGLVEELRKLQGQYDESQLRREYLLITRNNASFHACLAAATENEYVEEFAVRLYNMGRRVSFYIYQNEEDRDESFNRHARSLNADHEEIIDCVVAGDTARLVEVLTRHALLFRDRIMRAFVNVRSADFTPAMARLPRPHRPRDKVTDAPASA